MMRLEHHLTASTSLCPESTAVQVHTEKRKLVDWCIANCLAFIVKKTKEISDFRMRERSHRAFHINNTTVEVLSSTCNNRGWPTYFVFT